MFKPKKILDTEQLALVRLIKLLILNIQFTGTKIFLFFSHKSIKLIFLSSLPRSIQCSPGNQETFYFIVPKTISKFASLDVSNCQLSISSGFWLNVGLWTILFFIIPYCNRHRFACSDIVQKKKKKIVLHNIHWIKNKTKNQSLKLIRFFNCRWHPNNTNNYTLDFRKITKKK